MPWLLNGIYLLLLTAVSPVLLYRAVRHGKYRAGWREKLLGRVPQLVPTQERLWFHAVSVGEVLLLKRLIRDLRAQFPDISIILTTTTVTGYEVARNQYPGLTVCYCPLDFSWAVRNAIRRLNPTALILAELELWPNLIRSAAEAGVRLAIVNGRLSEKSFRGYVKLKPLVRNLLQKFDAIAVQNDEYAERFRILGAAEKGLFVTGSVKYDGVETERRNPRTVQLRRAFGIREDECVFIAGSTQHPEEAYALDCWQSLRDDHPNLRLILVPRHKERFDEVARLVERRKLGLLRRSETLNGVHQTPLLPPQTQPVLLLDTLGELSSCWGLADVAFVGGSLTSRGGQNMIEPAAYGAAVLFGPNTWNFRDAVTMLLSAKAAIVIRDPEELTQAVRRLIQSPASRERLGERARSAVISHQGATERTLHCLLETVVLASGSCEKIEAA